MSHLCTFESVTRMSKRLGKNISKFFCEREIMEEDREKKNSRTLNKSPKGLTPGDFEKMTESEFMCGVCQDLLYKTMALDCGHMFCKDCIDEWFTMRSVCPTCREPTEVDSQRPIFGVDSFIEKAVAFIGGEPAKNRQERIDASKTANNVGREMKSKSRSKLCFNVVVSQSSEFHLNLENGEDSEDMLIDHELEDEDNMSVVSEVFDWASTWSSDEDNAEVEAIINLDENDDSDVDVTINSSITF